MTDKQFEKIKKGLQFHSKGGIDNLCTMTETTLRIIIENAIKELEKENAELKEKLKPENCLKLLAKEGYIKFTSEQLTKAKEIIKKFSEFVNNEVEYDPEHPQEHTDLWNKLCEEAEQFLSEVEK